MSRRDTILGFLARAIGPICDDCLSIRTGITPRQTINMECRKLADAGRIRRGSSRDCSYCRCPKVCNLNFELVAAAVVEVPQAPAPAEGRNWHWEGNVQASLIAWLVHRGWQIQSSANTASRESGKDVTAQLGGRELWVSVKGYPVSTARTNAPTQARHWFSGAVFDVVCYRDESSTAELAIAVPDGFKTYLNLSKRVMWLRSQLPFRIYWVSQSGDVREE